MNKAFLFLSVVCLLLAGCKEKESKMVKLFFPTKDAIGFESVEKPTNGKPEHIVSLLVDIRALPANVAILSFTINGKKAHADMNAVYGSALKSTGTTGERY